MRRARGYVPLAVELPFAAKQTTLCLGGDLKATFGYHAGRYVFLSQPFATWSTRTAWLPIKKI